MIHLYWSEDNHRYEPEEDALARYEKEIDLFVQNTPNETNLLQYLQTLSRSYFNDIVLSHPKILPVLNVDENNEKFIEYKTSDCIFRITWCFHNIPEEQKIRPHRVIWKHKDHMYEERLSFPLEKEEERVMDIT